MVSPGCANVEHSQRPRLLRGYLALFVMGVSLWTMYGVLRRDVVVIIGNGITLLLVISVSVVKAREGKT
jgi:lipid-A-disaccharide synthase-like uncharacterized protein